MLTLDVDGVAAKIEIEKRKNNPEAVRDGLHDLHSRMEELSGELKIIKQMIEDNKPLGR